MVSILKTIYYYLFRPARISTTQNALSLNDEMSTEMVNGSYVQHNIDNINQHENAQWQQFILSIYTRFMRIINEKHMITNWHFYRKYIYTKTYFENDKYREQNNVTFYIIYHKIANFMPLSEMDIMQICEMNTDDKMRIIRLFIACINCLYEYINIYNE